MTSKNTRPLLAWGNRAFLRAGQPHRILSGSLHYFRVHPDLWSDRLYRLAAMGLNTVDTYVAWNFHEYEEGRVTFDGWRDLPRFVSIAADHGLDVIVRPGPFICAEWDNGGLPSWLTARNVSPRSSDPQFTEAVATWFDRLLPQLTGLQGACGGPIVAIQLENEYGSYGDDRDYLSWLRDALRSRGVTELLYTADGPTDLMLDAGSIDGTMASATFGSRPREALDHLRRRRPDEPFLCAEFWNGWFDHWGEKHHVRAPESAAGTVSDILELGGSVSLYMAHGGTNFGLWSGANHDGSTLQPTITSYDSDAPVAENGALTEKFHAMRAVFTGVLESPPPSLPEEPSVLPHMAVDLRPGGALLPSLRALGQTRQSVVPETFESLGQASGLVLYRARPTLPVGQVTISVRDLRDRAQVFVNNASVGVLEREDAELGIVVEGHGEPVDLELLVENLGRVNYGPRLGEHKGIIGGVQVDRRLIHGWTQTSLDVTHWRDTILTAGQRGRAETQGFYIADLTVNEPADTFISLPGSAKGFVWINDFLLGRYWDRGPQQTLYVPGPLLKRGENRINVLELEQSGGVLETREAPELGPVEEYVEEFAPAAAEMDYPDV